MAHRDGNDFPPSKKVRFDDRPATAKEIEARQQRLEVMHWKQRLRKFRSQGKKWKKHE